MIRKPKVVEVENARDGKGTIEIHHFLNEDELLGSAKIFAKVIIKPHSSIGWHQHIDDTEPYAILKGTGIFIDNDKSRTEVGAGDVCIINVGEFHSLENNTDEDLEFIALVINECNV